MDKNLALLMVTLCISVASIILGFNVNESDLIFGGIIATLICVILLYESSKKGYMKWWTILPLTILMIPSIVINVSSLNDWLPDILLSVPMFIAMASLIILMQVAYFDVRLGRGMFSLYMILSSSAMGGFLGAGYYIYNFPRGLSEELQQIANYWMGVEYLVITVAAIAVCAIIVYIMRKKDINLLITSHVLEEFE